MKKILVLVMIMMILNGCQKKPAETADYAEKLFDPAYIHEIDVKIAEEDYNDLLQDPTAKTKYTADVYIDGEKYQQVSFATKGNSSLYYVAALESNDRYSYKINFSKNIKDQTCHGLDKLNLNNLFSDPAYMKEFLCYDMFRSFGIKAPLLAYCVLKINGIERGFYEMVEDIDNSFLKRNFDGEGVLYKPEAELDLSIEEVIAIQENGLSVNDASNGADFSYIDDKPESYPDIFKNKVTHAEEEDEQRVIVALKGLSEGKDLEQYLDTKEIIRYFAVQNFLLNYDSYIGPMLHNSFLYENKGRLSLLPWDYNASFCSFAFIPLKVTGDDATLLINSGIDTPLLLTNEEKRPMWSWIVNNEGYRQQYHQAVDELLKLYCESGLYEQKIAELEKMLRPYVEKDPSAFYSVENFDKACAAIRKYYEFRTAAIRKQLDGKLSTYSDQQNKEDHVDASMLKISEL